jgi:hypothetical protein
MSIFKDNDIDINLLFHWDVMDDHIHILKLNKYYRDLYEVYIIHQIISSSHDKKIKTWDSETG